jgi:GNAT superfamily N-acetyltransferase
MRARARIEPLTEHQLEQALPLIAAYQHFYEVAEIDERRNRRFFARFTAPSEEGRLLGAWIEDDLVGFACLYWHKSSLSAADTVLMNDLYVEEGRRGAGAGRALIEASVEVARERGVATLEWATAPDNERAQRLYDSFGANRSDWVEYELRV